MFIYSFFKLPGCTARQNQMQDISLTVSVISAVRFLFVWVIIIQFLVSSPDPQSPSVRPERL